MTRDADVVSVPDPDDMWDGFLDPATGAPFEPADDDTTALTVTERHALNMDDFWESRPVFRHLHAFARSRMVGPWAVLGAAMARVVAAVSPNVQLPPTIGGFASLNLFVGLVGNSGDGKDAAQSVAAEALYIDVGETPFRVAPLGSGEGMSHMFMRPGKASKEDPYPEALQYNRSALVTIAEIDSMAALVQRQSSTLTSQLRQAAMGQQLGFFYADAAKRMIVPEHQYRLCLLAGIQPEKSGVLLNDSAGGTPQRFVWLPAGDPGMTRHAPKINTPMVWRPPDWMHAGRADHPEAPRMIIAEPEACVDTILTARETRGRASGTDAAAETLDSHAVLTRTKVAAALAIMDSRVAITDEDWDLSGVIMHVSDSQRALCLRALTNVQKKITIAKAIEQAETTVVVEERVDRAKVGKCADALKRTLRQSTEDWIPGNVLRTKLRQNHRSFMDAALDALILSNEVEVERYVYKGRDAVRYRIMK